MMTSFDQIHQEVKAKGKKRVVVAPVPAEMDFTALSKALGEGLVTPIVIGSSYALSSWVKGLGKKASEIEIIEETDAARALAIAIGMLKKGEADILMRGSLDPNRFLQTTLDKEKGLLKERVASLVSVFDPPVDQVTMVTDTYINSFPSIVEKVTITENVIRLARVHIPPFAEATHTPVFMPRPPVGITRCTASPASRSRWRRALFELQIHMTRSPAIVATGRR